MKRYLKTLSRTEAQRIIIERAKRIEDEEYVAVIESIGRITSRPVYASDSNPAFLLSAMDGYAVDFSKTLSADLLNPIELEKHKDAYPVATGDPLPEGTNSVIMIEEIEEKESSIIIRKPSTLWQNVRVIGEDIVQGELILPRRHILRPFDVGLLLSVGITHIHVLRKPKLLIIPTGEEIIDPYSDSDKHWQKGRIFDFNSYVLSSLAEECGFSVFKEKIARTKEELERILEDNLDNFDACIINAGTSAGERDFTREVIESKGEVLFHGVRIMPGKPFLFGMIREKPIFGIPGYPVSAIFCFREFVLPYLEEVMGVRSDKKFTTKVKMFYKTPSKMGVEELIRVNLIKKGHSIYAIPLARGASLMSSLAYADGIVRIPEELEGIEEENEVDCELLINPEILDGRITIIGSHDILLSILRDLLREKDPRSELLSVACGSLSGIVAFKRGIADLVTTHIFDPEERAYNVPILKRLLGDKRWTLINLAKRSLGIVVRKGNPKGIKSIEDIALKRAKFINRQVGSGTRILFDLYLKEKGIQKESIDGYEKEESSHMKVGVMIKMGAADCGITTLTVARLFDLDFIPLAEEDFDLLVSEEILNDVSFRKLYDIISSSVFKDRLSSLGGYNLSETGQIKYVNG